MNQDRVDDQDGMGRCRYGAFRGNEAKCPRSKLGKYKLSLPSPKVRHRVENLTHSQVRSQQYWKNGNSPGNKRRPGVVATEIELPVSLGSRTRATARTAGPAEFKARHEGGENKGFVNEVHNLPVLYTRLCGSVNFPEIVKGNSAPKGLF